MDARDISKKFERRSISEPSKDYSSAVRCSMAIRRPTAGRLLDRMRIETLGSFGYIPERHNAIIGIPEPETHLSIALGFKVCMQGVNERLYTAVNLSNELIEALDGHQLLKLEKQVASCDLLDIDEMSYLAFNRHKPELFQGNCRPERRKEHYCIHESSVLRVVDRVWETDHGYP